MAASTDRGIAQLGGVASLLDGIDETTVRRVMDEAVTHIKLKNQRRIAANKLPGGGKMEARTPVESNAHISFVYETPDGQRKIRNLKNYRNLGYVLTGHDRFRGGMRSFLKDRIVRYISIDKSKVIKRRQQKMFRGLIKARWLKAKLTKQEAAIYFAGVANPVAAVHHFGETDKPNPKAKPVRYPERTLLAITDEDIDEAEDILLTPFDLFR